MKLLEIAQAPTASEAFDKLQEYHSLVERCSRCVFDVNTPSIKFDADGVCNYCGTCEQLEKQYPMGSEGTRILEQLVDQIKRAGRGKPFDVVIGVSGGCDSSYMVAKAKEWGLRPLAAHFDNTWNSTIATQNIHSVLSKLGVELFTYVVDNEEYNDICRAFIDAGVIEIETPTDIGLATTLYMAAEKYGVKYQFEGHSFRTEGVAPLGWCYMDGKYIESVVKAHGNYSQHRMRSFPNLWFGRFLKYMLLNRVKKIRPIYWMDYDKEKTKQWLTANYGWQWYGGHHLENRFTAFFHSYYAPRRFGVDTRVVGYSGLIRSHQMTRQQALMELTKPFHFDDEIVDIVKRRLRFSDAAFEAAMAGPTRTYRDFKTYKPLFERLRPFFYLMAKADLVPQSFYLKYTSKSCL
ncbi:MAG: N-acetyl sugar amidotransferase [Verrucomicrobiales bacterium]